MPGVKVVENVCIDIPEQRHGHIRMYYNLVATGVHESLSLSILEWRYRLAVTVEEGQLGFKSLKGVDLGPGLILCVDY